MEENKLQDNDNQNNDIKIEQSTDIKDEQSKGKTIVKNIVFVAISNIFSLVAGVLVGFMIPKIMPKVDYGFYKTFTLYFEYIGLFPLGFIDGIYLIYAGKKYADLNKEKFRTYTKFLLFFQTIISVVIMISSIPFMSYELGIIFFCLGINVVFNSMTGYFQFISQVTGRFKELSIRNVIKAALTSISIVILTILCHFEVIDYVSYNTYIIIFTSISIFLTLWYAFTYREILFGKSAKLKEEKKEILYFFKIGFPLLVANLVSGFILSIDRQFVSIAFDIETYASYAFAYSMLGLITVLTSAISIVLYPTIKTLGEDQLKNNYNRFNSIISIVVSLFAGAYYPLKFIVENFLPNYLDSLPIFRIILPGLIITSCISMIMFNYYKAINKQTRYFIISLMTLGLSFGANMIAYFAFKKTIAISIASVIVMAIWYFIVEYFIIKRYKLNPIKNILYITLMISMFYVLTYFVDNVFIGFGIYLSLYVAITLSFHFKLIKSKFKFDK